MPNDTLHPTIQLKFGLIQTQFLATIPPDSLIEFTFDSELIDTCQITFIDHTYGRVEQELLNSDREENGGKLLLRWGYPGEGLEEQDWKNLELVDFTSDMTTSGTRITIMGYSTGASGATRVIPAIYLGSISSVARQVAADMGYTDDAKIFIEDTDDLNRDVEPRANWSTGNKTRIDFIQEKLLTEARSKTNPNGSYYFRLGSEGTFEFCTQFFKKIAAEVHGSPEPEKEVPTTGTRTSKAYRTIEVMFGIPDGKPGGLPNQVLRWRPHYLTKAMGTFARMTIAGTFDPRTKQFVQTVVDRNTQGMTSQKDPRSGGRTVAPPITTSKDKIEQRRLSDAFVFQPSKQVALGGHCSGKAVHAHQGPIEALNKITGAWRRLHNSLMGATLELAGVPENCDISFLERFIFVTVVLPTGSPTVDGVPEGTNEGLHWSTGLYQIKHVNHSITSRYVITVEFYKPTGLDGPDEAKTGQADVIAPIISSVS